MALKFALNSKTKEAITKTTGIPAVSINEMSSEDLDSSISKKTGRGFKLDTSKNTRFVAGRGSVYLALARFIGINVDKEIGKI